MANTWQNAQRWCLVYMALLGATLLFSNFSHAQDSAAAGAPSIVYIAIEPDIVTNYAGDNSERLGFLSITIEMMLDEPSLIPELEHHMPLLRATAIQVIGAQPEQKIKSLTGREEMRRLILKRFRDLLTKETGDEVVKDIIFTKYLSQGG
jgi:flagellar FliL protein